jgi:folate-binding protein YgfZ
MTLASVVEEARALARAAGVRPRQDLRAVLVSGDDAVDWLNGQVTNDVRAIARGHGVYALAVTVRGKIMADVWILGRAAGLTVLLPESALATVLESFESQIIMEDVVLEKRDARVLSIQGPRSGEALERSGLQDACACDELGAGGFFVLCEPAMLDDAFARLRAAAEHVGGGEVGEQGFELARLRAGRPRYAMDFGERHYPQEAGLTPRAVSFEKGCYLGQEVVCTLESRGHVSRELHRLELPGSDVPESGTELLDAEGRPVGSVTSAIFDPERGAVLGLGYVKRSAVASGTALRAARSSVRVLGACASA